MINWLVVSCRIPRLVNCKPSSMTCSAMLSAFTRPCLTLGMVKDLCCFIFSISWPSRHRTLWILWCLLYMSLELRFFSSTSNWSFIKWIITHTSNEPNPNGEPSQFWITSHSCCIFPSTWLAGASQRQRAISLTDFPTKPLPVVSIRHTNHLTECWSNSRPAKTIMLRGCL